MEPIILVHGGAGEIPDSRVQPKLIGCRAAAKAGYEVLKGGGSALDAVEAAVRSMEDGEAFNAGFGSVLNLDGEVEMDALLMNGSDLNAGAVTVVKDIAHPISLARLVMEKTPHVLLAGQGANKFAREQGVPTLAPGALISDYARSALEAYKKGAKARTEIGDKDNKGEVGTVGAVAIDKNGHVASATSTGGINGKMVGRSSDTSQVGSGGYADDYVGAVSTTGHGESITKFSLAHTIVSRMAAGLSAGDATEQSLKDMTKRLNNTAGAITLSNKGDIGIYHTSRRMAWAYQKQNEIHYGIENGQHEQEILQ